MGRAITLFASLLVVAALLTMACMSTGTPAGFDSLMNQANARMTATAAAAAQTEADVVVTAIAQKTAQARQEEFHVLTVEAAQANATTQAQADATAMIEAQVQATAQSHVEETRMAIEGTVVAATHQAGQAQGTATAEAQRVQTTSTAQAQAAGTATAATATAQVENPIATRTAADTAAPVSGPVRAYRVLRPGTTLPPQVQRVMDHAVVASLNRDWEERDE